MSSDIWPMRGIQRCKRCDGKYDTQGPEYSPPGWCRACWDAALVELNNHGKAVNAEIETLRQEVETLKTHRLMRIYKTKAEARETGFTDGYVKGKREGDAEIERLRAGIEGLQVDADRAYRTKSLPTAKGYAYAIRDKCDELLKGAGDAQSGDSRKDG